jgi:hypothetical protein
VEDIGDNLALSKPLSAYRRFRGSRKSKQQRERELAEGQEKEWQEGKGEKEGPLPWWDRWIMTPLLGPRKQEGEWRLTLDPEVMDPFT